MKSRSVPTVPVGPIDSIKRFLIYTLNIASEAIRAKKINSFHFLLISSFAVVLTLGLYSYSSSFVYIVFLGDRQVGISPVDKDVELLVAELADRTSEFYGMKMELSEELKLVKDFRPESKPHFDEIEAQIRQQATFVTEAYMLKVDGREFVALADKKDLFQIESAIKQAYSKNSSNSRVINASIIEDLDIEPCEVEPDSICTPEEVVDLFVTSPSQSEIRATFAANQDGRSGLGSRYSSSLSYDINEDTSSDFSFASQADFLPVPVSGEADINVRTLEEEILKEPIPFDIEITYDEELWIVQKEILTPGQEGIKEVVYYVTRENGVEVERKKIEERITLEPLTQVEAHGLAKVPSIGSGEFAWPVEGGGGITPGRGFSDWHTGIDINGPMGTNILAADAGVVWFSGQGGTQGNYIIVYHGSYWTLYLHNSQNLVKEGQQVNQGDVIAKLGSTGRSTGPHLHFEVRLDDGSGEWHTYYQHKPIDPLRFFKP